MKETKKNLKKNSFVDLASNAKHYLLYDQHH